MPGTEGLSKEKIMLLAEETGVSKDPMGGNGGWYDGWASIKVRPDRQDSSSLTKESISHLKYHLRCANISGDDKWRPTPCLCVKAKIFANDPATW